MRQQRHTQPLPVIFFTLISTFIGCGGDSKTGDIFQMSISGGSGSIEVTGKESGNVIAIPFSAPNSQDISGASNFTLQIDKVSNAKLNSPKLKSIGELAIKPKLPASTNQNSSRLAQLAHEKLARQELDATLTSFRNYNTLHGPLDIKAMYPTHSTPLLNFKTFSSSISLFSPFTGEKNNSITGNLLVSNGTVGLYLDSRDAGSISTTNATSILQTFSSISYARVHTLVGNESDVNNDGGLEIFVSSKMPSGLLGFFRPIDLLPDGVDPATKSNVREIIYAALPTNGTGDALFHATLAHELFHLVNFGIKSLPIFQSSGGSNIVVEELFLNEGAAHLMEDLCGWGGGDTYAVAEEFLTNANKVSVAGSVDTTLQSGGSDDTLARRGATMLFLRYLFEQKGGANYSTSDAGALSGGGVAFYKALTSSSQTGIPNIEAASGISFAETYGKWVAALYLDGTGLVDDPLYNYQDIVVDSFTNGPRGFDMHGNRVISTGSTVTLNGPTLLSTLTGSSSLTAQTSGSLQLSGSNFVLAKLGSNGKTTFSFQGASSASPGVTFIVLP